MKIIINQGGHGFFTVGGNQFINISKVEIDGNKIYSVGVENISFGLYKKEKKALSAMNSVMGFLCDETRDSFRFELDK